MLLESFQLGDLTLANRVALAPMTRARAGVERLPNALMAEYYAQRASAGLIITEATVVSEQGIGWPNTPGIYTPEQSAAWRQVVAAVHAKGTPVFMQLWHCGRASHSSFHQGELPVAPSAIKLEGDMIHTPEGKENYETPRALETEEIPGIVEDYRRAAELARDAGFDGIEIHSANGYLLDEFLQSKTNHREDRYGGSLENRLRLLNEIIQAALTVFPANRIAARFSPNGVFNDMGSPDYRETFLYAAERLNAYGLGYLHVMDGLAFGFHGLGEPMTLADFRQVYQGPIMGNCGHTLESAEAAIGAGDCDLVAFGRPYITNPDLVERFRNGWPLSDYSDMKGWYSFGPEGYADYPAYQAG
jgi:N-ethylmaleimide reductase